MNDTFQSIICITLIIEAFLALFLLSHMLLPKPMRFRGPLIGCYFIVYSLCLILQDIFADSFLLYIVTHIFMMFFYACIFGTGKIIFKLFLPLIFVSLITLSGFPVSIFHFTLIRMGYPVYLFKLLSSCNLFVITLFLLHFKIDTLKHYPSSYYITMIVMPILNMISIYLLKGYRGIFPYIDLTGCLTLLLELLIYYMIWQSTKEYAKNIRLELIQQQQQYQIRHMQELRDVVMDYHKIRHDMKNHFVCIDRMLSQEKYQSLKEYFYSLCQTLYALDNQIETGNEIVNQVINIKYATAQRLGIPMEIETAIPHKLSIPDYLLCSVLSNLLDNAMEASAKIAQPSIFIKITMVKTYLSVTVQNRLEDWQHESAQAHKTTKAQPHLHGLGLHIIQETVQKYNGISTYEIQGDMYVASILLECTPIP